ncbi:MAG: cyclic lactone autoinducer peptide [Clostridiaceae bacterium]
MRDLRGNIFEMVSDKATDLICKAAIKVTESSCNKCWFIGVYESEFPMELEEDLH